MMLQAEKGKVKHWIIGLESIESGKQIVDFFISYIKNLQFI